MVHLSAQVQKIEGIKLLQPCFIKSIILLHLLFKDKALKKTLDMSCGERTKKNYYH